MSKYVKIVVTVPEADADKMRQIIGDTGAGSVGNYTHCSFSSKGVGRFLPNEGANPTIGTVDKAEEVNEERIEFNCSKSDLAKTVSTIKFLHPYEEPAIDVYETLDY